MPDKKGRGKGGSSKKKGGAKARSKGGKDADASQGGGLLSSDLIDALNKTETQLEPKDVRSVMKVYAKRFSGDRLASLEKSVNLLRSKTVKLRQKMEAQKDKSETVIRELKRQVSERDDAIFTLKQTVEDLKREVAETKAKSVAEARRVAAENREKFQAQESQLRAWEAKGVEMNGIIADRKALREDLEKKDRTLLEYEKEKTATLGELEAKYDARYGALQQNYETANSRIKDLTSEIEGLRLRKKRRNQRPKVPKHKHKAKDSFGYMHKTIVDQAESDVMTRTMVARVSPESSPKGSPRNENAMKGSTSLPVLPQARPRRKRPDYGSPLGLDRRGFSLKNFIIVPKYAVRNSSRNHFTG